MKRLLIASAAALAAGGQALAADLPPPVAPPPRAPAMYIPVAPPYNWSGFYIGGNLGAGWNSGGSVSDTFGSTFSGSGQTTKFIGGGQVGVTTSSGAGSLLARRPCLIGSRIQRTPGPQRQARQHHFRVP